MDGHQPVLKKEVLKALTPSEGYWYLDCTFGGGGHSEAILESAKNIKITALDCDHEAIDRAKILHTKYPQQFNFHNVNFSNLDRIPGSGYAGAIFDLGLSSFHVDSKERGFSFKYDGPLDMRFDRRTDLTASEFLETAPRNELVKAIRNFGEEPSWHRIVYKIFAARGTGILSETQSFADLVVKAKGKIAGSRRIHPATKVFQGLRIYINRELEFIEKALPIAFEKLSPGGILAVISFHSLEDRIVKRYFRKMAGQPIHKEDQTPQQSRTSYAEILTRRPIQPGDDECEINRRARSAKMRVLKKLSNS